MGIGTGTVGIGGGRYPPVKRPQLVPTSRSFTYMLKEITNHLLMFELGLHNIEKN